MKNSIPLDIADIDNLLRPGDTVSKGALSLVLNSHQTAINHGGFISMSASGGVTRPASERILEVPTVTDFGGRGDGTTDDTDAFIKAIAASPVVIIPPSPAAYILSETLQLKSGQALLGFSRATSVIKYIGASAAIRTGHNDPGIKLRNRIESLSIIGEKNAEALGIHLERAHMASLNDIAIIDIGGTGILISGPKLGSERGEAHGNSLWNIDIMGVHRRGLKIQGDTKYNSANRQRVFYLNVNGSSDVAIEIRGGVDTSQFFGTSVEDVGGGVLLEGKYHMFYGLNIENWSAFAVKFLDGCVGNRFYGATVDNIIGSWVNAEKNVLEAFPNRPDFVL